MFNRTIGIAVIATIDLLSPAALRSAPITRLSLAELIEKSDLVVAGIVEKTQAVGRSTVPAGGHEMNATVVQSELRVSAILKGVDVPAAVQFQSLVTDAPSGYDLVPGGLYRVYFLARSSGTYAPANVFQLSMPAAPYTGSSGPTVAERVADAVGSVLSAPTASAATKEEALIALGTSGERHSTVPLRKALSDPDERIRLRAVAMLIRFGDPSAIPIAEDVLMDRLVVPAECMSWLRSAIRELHGQLVSVPFVPFLQRLAASQDRDTRFAAVLALSMSGTPAAIPGLAAALESGDHELQLMAARGLLNITGQRTPADTLTADPGGARLIAFWTDWARARGLIR